MRLHTPSITSQLGTPSYEGSEASHHYISAKKSLADGDFELALTTIEEGIAETQKNLLTNDAENIELHESLAPFHYLYGTTLLYSIEESKDTQVTIDGMQGRVNNDGDEAEEATDDMHIAWENLDVSRSIVESKLEGDIPDHLKRKLQLALAQILLREGDLQRMNGRYEDAIHDYQACLGLRKKLLPEWDRKLADVQYNLGLSFLNNSNELQKEGSSDETKHKASLHCQSGVELYLACAKTLCGHIATLSGVDPHLIFKEGKSTSTTGKTTGLNLSSYANASFELEGWRQSIDKLSSGSAVEHLKELLDEIQETIDEVEKSQEAVREASQLRKQAQKEADDEAPENGITTTIGFGRSTIGCVSKQDALKPNSANPKMMVVKRKNKHPSNSEKRLKTE